MFYLLQRNIPAAGSGFEQVTDLTGIYTERENVPGRSLEHDRAFGRFDDQVSLVSYRVYPARNVTDRNVAFSRFNIDLPYRIDNGFGRTARKVHLRLQRDIKFNVLAGEAFRHRPGRRTFGTYMRDHQPIRFSG